MEFEKWTSVKKELDKKLKNSMTASHPMWEILDTGCSSAEENMRLDAELLSSLAERKRPILRHYDWAGKCATYGYLTKTDHYLDLVKVEKTGLQLAKRPTGGGIVFHIWDLAFSVLVPASCPLFSENTLANYALVNNFVLKAAVAFMDGRIEASMTPEDAPALDAFCKRFCMAQPTKYDVVWQGRKIAGAAQRQTKHGFLHQGTISLAAPDFSLLEQVLLPGTQVLDAMRMNTFAMLGDNEDYLAARDKMKQLLSSYLPYEY